MIRPRDLRAASLAALLGLACSGAHGAEAYGLMPARDLTPFGFVRLDMRPFHTVPIRQGDWAIEAEFASQNTWALSPNVEQYLESRPSGGRRERGPAELDAIRALPGESYLVDLESRSVDVTAHYRFSRVWSAYLITSAVFY